MRKLTLEQAEKRHSDLIKGQVWIDTDTKYRYLCAKHGEYIQRFEIHDSGSGCGICGKQKRSVSRRLAIEDIEKRFLDMLPNQIWRADSKYYFVCEIHGKYLQSYKSHGQGRRCSKCRVRRIIESKLFTVEEVENLFSDFKKGQIWCGSDKEYVFICAIHGEYKQLYNGHQQGHRCSKCAGRLCTTIKEAKNCCPDLKSGQMWQGNHSKYIFTCKKHGEYLQEFACHQTGSTCPRCRESKGEKAVLEYLQLRNVDRLFHRQLRLSDCRDQQTLPFDFGSTENKILIEYHGQQHYEPMRFHNAKEKFKSVQKHDRIKKTWARRNGWKLIVIPYTIKNIESFLDKRLKEILELNAKQSKRHKRK